MTDRTYNITITAMHALAVALVFAAWIALVFVEVKS